MTLPNFLIVGAMKAGTTWLSFNLENHPQVYIPKDELHFFNNTKIFNRGFQWYESQFSQAGNAIAIGEKTAGYLLNQKTPKVLSETIPDAKIIIVLRDPVKRAISQLNHHIRYGEISPNLSPEGLLESEDFKRIDQEFSILARGQYLEQIKRYYDYFDSSRILIIINEVDIRQRSGETLVNTCEFLNIDASFEFSMKDKRIHENRNSKLGTSLAFKMPWIRPLVAKLDRYIPGEKVPPFKLVDSEIRKLHQVYEQSNDQLFKFLNREMPSAWAYRAVR